MIDADFLPFDTDEALHAACVERIVTAATAAVEQRGRFFLVLAGGTTPRGAYALLAQAPWRQYVPWNDVHVFWGDERCVPPDHEASNYRMAYESLLSRVPIPAMNVHRMRGEAPPEDEAQRYEKVLRDTLGPGGRLDLTLLGAGPDGHTASLFPNSATLHEMARWVVPTAGPPPYPKRLSLTYPILNASRSVLVLATGSEKAPVIERLRATVVDSDSAPIAGIRPVDSRVVWLVDREALPPRP
jgi:6-phosphogluconolactonase